VTARVSDPEGVLGVSGTLRAERLADEMQLEVSGSCSDLYQRKGVDVTLTAKARDLAVVAELLELEQSLPPIAPVVATGTIRDRGETYGFDGTLQLGRPGDVWLEARAKVADLQSAQGVEVQLAFELETLDPIRTWLKHDLPRLSPLRGSAKLSDEDGSLGIEEFQVSGGSEIEVVVSASFDDLWQGDEISVTTDLKAKNLSALGKLAGIELPDAGPVRFKGTVTGAVERIRSAGMLRVDQTLIEGRWSGSFVADKRPSITAIISSPHLHLDDIGIVPRETQREPETESEWRATDPLPVEWLHAIDVDLKLRADRVTGYQGFELRNAAVAARLDNARLSVSNSTFRFRGGEIDLDLVLDARTANPQVSMDLHAAGVDLNRLMSQFEQDTEHTGMLNLVFDLNSEGTSVAQWIQNLDGTAEAIVWEGNLASRYGREFVHEFARVSLPGLKPQRQTASCIGAKFAIEDGVADSELLLLEAPAITVTGSGSIDLAGNAFKLRLFPHPRDPSLLSLTATVDVTGRLAKPVFTPVRRTLATGAARAVLANARKLGALVTSPLPLNRKELQSVCQRALGPRPDYAIDVAAPPVTAPEEKKRRWGFGRK